MTFIEKAKIVHGNKYDYSLVDYKNNYTKVKIICPIHGVFEQKPYAHTSNKSGCPKCGLEKSSKKQRMSYEKFIEKAKTVHGNKYDYSLVKYINAKTKIKIICPIHGVFEQIPDNHLRKNYGCPKCKASHGENKIRILLKKNNILFEEQKRFKDCKNKLPLPFDFYIPSLNTVIEFQGEQHYTPMKYSNSKEKFIKTKEFCISNNINFIEIKYNEDIESILTTICTVRYQDQS
jgi:very-short-patch-repair endonuclease